MAPCFAPQDLDCPDPAHCPVVATLPRLRTTTLRAGTAWFRVYNATWGYDEYNPGHGDARLSPIDDPVTGTRLPSMYLAGTPSAALLETVFHDVHHDSARTIYERDLRGKLMAHVRAPSAALLADLRDPELERLGLRRDYIVSTAAEHYPCTRRVALTALRQPHGKRTLRGLIWHSRQAELAGHDPVEVVVLFGEPRDSTARGSWRLADRHWRHRGRLPPPGQRPVKDRMDITATRWSLPGAEAVLTAPSTATRQLDAYWNFHLDQERHPNHESHFPNPQPRHPASRMNASRKELHPQISARLVNSRRRTRSSVRQFRQLAAGCHRDQRTLPAPPGPPRR